VKAYYKNRYELKYVLDLKTYYSILRDIEIFCKKDVYGGQSGKYKVISLYFDTANLKFFWEKIDGEERRTKLRLRTYKHMDISMKSKHDTFIELKKKINQNVMKKRALIDLNHAEEFIRTMKFNHNLMKDMDENQKETIAEAEYLHSKFKLKPHIVVSYTRQAFVSKDNLNLRITFDSNIKYRKNDFSLNTKYTDKYVLPPDMVIMEIKYSDYLPHLVVQIIQKHCCNVQAFSKYCNGVQNSFIEQPVLGEIYGMVY